MATTTTRKTTARKTSPAKPAAEKQDTTADVKTDAVIDTSENVAQAAKPEKIIPKKIDLNQFIPVRNGFHGMLIYRSSRTGEEFVWDGFGTEQDIELLELRNAKNGAKQFFINNWFMFDDEYRWVIDYLGLQQYYRYALSIEEFDKLFDMPPEELKEAIAEMSNGQKRSLGYRAMELIATGEIDSRKTITALEEALGMELIEK